MTSWVSAVVVIAALGVLAWWRYEDRELMKAQLQLWSQAYERQLQHESTLLDRIQRPWGEQEAPERKTNAVDLLEQIDQEWLDSPLSEVELDADLAAIGLDDDEEWEV